MGDWLPPRSANIYTPLKSRDTALPCPYFSELVLDKEGKLNNFSIWFVVSLIGPKAGWKPALLY
jgi:hypothetical protein